MNNRFQDLNFYTTDDVMNDGLMRRKEDHFIENDEEVGFEFSLDSSPANTFVLENVKIPDLNIKQNDIIKMSVNESFILIYTNRNKLYRWKFEEDRIQEIEFPEPEKGSNSNLLFQMPASFLNAIKQPFVSSEKKEFGDINKIFIGPKGYHSILSSTNGDNFYLNVNSNKLQLMKYKEYITAIAWDDQKALIGNSRGDLYLHILNKNDVGQLVATELPQFLYKIPRQDTIQHLEIIKLDKRDKNDKDKYIIIASLESTFFYFDGPQDFELLFSNIKKYDDRQLQDLEIPPGNFKQYHRTLMHLYYNKNNKPHSILWTNGQSLNLYKLNEHLDQNVSQIQVKNIFTKHQALAYLKNVNDVQNYMISEQPINVALTEFYYFILHKECLTVISRITEKVEKCYDFQSMGLNNMIDMIFDKQQQCIWLYNQKYIQRLAILNEDKDAWKLYLEMNQYKDAYEICKKYNSPYKSYIGSLYAEQLLKDNKYDEASIKFAETDKSIEEIGLKLIIDNQAKGLEVYLKEWLKKIRQKDLPQKTILLTLLTEIKLQKLNQIDYDYNICLNHKNNSKNKEENEKMFNKSINIKKQIEEQKKELINFLSFYLDDLDEDITYQLMQSHGRFDELINYAQQKGNYEMIILHHINEEEYDLAIKKLRQIKDDKVIETIYKYSHIFMKHVPELTIQQLKTYSNQILKIDPTRLIVGLMDIPPEKRDLAIDYLSYCIDVMECNDKELYNLLIFFYSEQTDNQVQLRQFLLKQEQYFLENEQANFDFDFALRIFKRKNLVEAQIMIYGMMSLYNEAISLALEHNYIEIAKKYANKPESDETKKALWLEIAKHLLKDNEKNIQQVIKLTEDNPELIKIEYLLPYFNDNIKISHFKEEICKSLNEYNVKIENLKQEMKGYSQNADQLKNELKQLKNKYLIIDDKANCDQCENKIFLGEEQFYIFPCLHGFHQKCLIQKLEENPVELYKLQDIRELQKQMDELQQRINQNQLSKNQSQNDKGNFIFNYFTKQKTQQIEPLQQNNSVLDDEKDLKKKKEIYHKKLANECPNCGQNIVESIYHSFNVDDSVKKSWNI